MFDMDRESIKVLLIEDDEDDYIVTRDLLSDIEGDRYELTWDPSSESALESMTNNKHDVYLLDYRLGGRTGLELLQEAVRNGCRGPMILLTGQGDKEIDLEAMKAGASDYLVKGQINAPLLERSIRYAMERKRTEERIFRMAYYDNLTDLPNRVLFHDRLRQAIINAERNETLSAILFLDVDNFKRINDTFGHYMADRLLKEIAERLNTTMRKSDSIARPIIPDLFARLGGDEFTVLLSEIRDAEDAARVAQRIINTLSRPFLLDNKEIFITSSIGIALFPDDGKDIDSLLKNADAAMYHAKEQGKNNYQYYRKSMNAAAFERLTLENNLRKAVEREELLLYYQPQLDFRTGQIIAMEAMLRWRHPDRGTIMPSEFMPLAEESGLIIPVSEWVLNTACKQNRAWQQAGLPAVPVSVKLSSLLFRQKDILTQTRQILENAHLNPEYLIMEITENTLMYNADTTISTLTRLSEMGLRLAIDDFGTGYSSLNYLKRFPLYAIKIDPSFVKEIAKNTDGAAVVAAIIAMAHRLTIKVIAQGVETERQMAFLHEHGCDGIQGCLLSPPVSNDEASKLLAIERDDRPVTPLNYRIFIDTIGTRHSK